jgi:hypothetical protein
MIQRLGRRDLVVAGTSLGQGFRAECEPLISLPAVVPTKSLERRAQELNSHQLNEAAALTSQRALGDWEKLRRAVVPVDSRDRRAGFATSGQTFGICCRSGVQESRFPCPAPSSTFR